MVGNDTDYQVIEQLHSEKKTVLYRARRGVDAETVLIKTFLEDFPSKAEILQLKREYDVARKAALPGVVAPLALEQHQHTWLLVLEDAGGGTLEQQLANGPLELVTFLKTAVQLADLVMQLHRKNMIHKDIKPANLLFDQKRGLLQITNFASASLLSGERSELLKPDALEGSLPYMSPEQTGRMHRPTDVRSDLYSLGVTMYEMATGRLPFVAQDSAQLIYKHLTAEPVSPVLVAPWLPQPVSDLILKCLAKHAEDRYQSAYGIKHDLEICLHQLLEEGQVKAFAIGKADRSEHFRLPDALYGREKHLDILRAALERVGRGGCEAVFVSGPSGVGKSSLVQELKRIVHEIPGFFVVGKFDQRNQVPYQAILHGLNEQVHRLLAESEETVANWRERILSTIGPSMPVVIDVLPDLEVIVGKQPPIAPQPTWEAQNRFRDALQNLLGLMATHEHPLVLFLDDLQWADQASLNLIAQLLSERTTRHLLLIGNYRDDEPQSSDALPSLISSLQEKGAPLQEVRLAPLEVEHVQRMIADTLRCSGEQTGKLAQAVMEKGGGNPFFIKQFLHTLHAQGYLVLDEKTGEWQWDVGTIRQLEVSASQLDFMVSKIRELPVSTQGLLKAASCIGSLFDLQTLHIAEGRELSEVASDLLRALEAGILLSPGTAYKWLYDICDEEMQEEWLDLSRLSFQFLHDRVQQAAYELLTEEERKATHLKIGRWLSWQNRLGEMEDRLFERVNHLNEAMEWITYLPEREELAMLNLEAGKRAKIATAYEQSLRYLVLGTELLTAECWESQYELAFALYKERYEVEYRSGQEERADEWFRLLLARAKTDLDKAHVYVVKNELYIFSDRMEEALRTGEEALRLLGFKGSLRMSRFSKWLAYRKLKRDTHQKSMREWVDAPLAFDPYVITLIETMNSMGLPAYHVDPAMYHSLRMKMIETSQQHGVTERTGPAYVGVGVMVLAEFGDYETADRLARIGVEMEAAVQAKKGAVSCNGLHFYANEIQRWTQHNQASVDSLLQVAQWALDSGDLMRAVYSLADRMQRQVYGGISLEELRRDVQQHMNTYRRSKSEWILCLVQITLSFVANLQSEADSGASLSSQDFDEEQYRLDVLPLQNSIWHTWYYFCKILLHYLDEDYTAILQMIPNISEDVVTAESDFPFLYALTYAAVYPNATPTEQVLYRKKLRAYRKVMKKWARMCPENFLHRSLLIEAEAARISGQDRKAMDLYDQAVATATRHGYQHHASMASECAARYYSQIGKGHLAVTYLTAAHYGYLQWGAVKKAKRLEERHPLLRTAQTESVATSASIDLQAVMKAARTISGEIVLEKLLERLIEIVVENAGAQKVLLLMQQEGEWQVVARKMPDDPEILLFEQTLWQECRDLSAMVMQYVSRRQEVIVVHDAVESDFFATDPYIREQRPKSILCLPILHHGSMLGIIYLENNLMTHGFTTDRLEVMNLLSAQIAVSIQNAELFQRQVQLNKAYGRFVPHQFLRLLQKKSILDVELGDHVQMDMTVLFADIRSFTALSEQMTPEENFYFLNEFLSRMEPVIKRHNGFIDKYIGDSIMALFDRSADDAVCAATAILRELRLFNQERTAEGKEPIRVGIGLNSGHLMLGTLGGHERMDSTVISDTVNLASRVEDLTKTYQVPLLISEHTQQRLQHPDHFFIRPVDVVAVRGKSEKVTLYEVFDPEGDEVAELKRKMNPLYQHAFDATRLNRLDEARTLLEACLLVYPDDPVMKMHLARCKEGK